MNATSEKPASFERFWLERQLGAFDLQSRAFEKYHTARDSRSVAMRSLAVPSARIALSSPEVRRRSRVAYQRSRRARGGKRLDVTLAVVAMLVSLWLWPAMKQLPFWNLGVIAAITAVGIHAVRRKVGFMQYLRQMSVGGFHVIRPVSSGLYDAFRVDRAALTRQRIKGHSGLAAGTSVFYMTHPQDGVIFVSTDSDDVPSLHNFFAAVRAAVRAESDAAKAKSALDVASKMSATINERAEEWARVHIPSEQKHQLITLAEMFLAGDSVAPKGTLLHGPSGTGKTMIARVISKTIGCEFLSLSVPDLKAGFHGQSGQLVRTLWNKARAAGRAVIFIDECEGIFAKRGSLASDRLTDELVQAFLAEWDGVESSGAVWVIGATNRRDLIDPAILSRFGGNEFCIELPGADLRRDILIAELARAGMDAQILPPNIGELTQGMSGRDLHNLPGRIKTLSHPRPATNAHVVTAITALRGPGAAAVGSTASWDTLIVSDELKTLLQDSCAMFKHAEALTSRGISMPRGLLLTGPAGTGKTQVARTLASESGLRFVSASTADLKAGYTGQSGQSVQSLFEKARSGGPCILFLDEIDIIAPARGTGDSFTEEIIGQLLQELDGISTPSSPVFVIAATNCPEAIDAAVKSRFPQTVEIPLPDLESRERILKALLRGKPSAVADATLTRLASLTEGRSGRYLRDRVDDAERLAVRRALRSGNPDSVCITDDDFSF